MAKSVQMDVNEFFNVLFEKLEQSLKGSPHANLLDHVFGGTLSNQLLGRESSCSHQRSRDENFYILSLDVKGKKNVGESLKSFVEGEMLEGDNKFLCGECQRKVDTLKRVCIKNTPNNLILHLKVKQRNPRGVQHAWSSGVRVGAPSIFAIGILTIWFRACFASFLLNRSASSSTWTR